MSHTDVGHHAYGGQYYALQLFHLSWLGDACLDDGYVVVLVDEPHA